MPVVDDVVAGSSVGAHDASLSAMEYLQTGARRSMDEVVDAMRARHAAVAPVARLG